MALKIATVLFAVVTALSPGPRLPIPEFDINLDVAPQERFTEVLQHFKQPLQEFVAHLHGNNRAIKFLLAEVVKRRGPENDEFQAEIRNVAKITGIPEADAHALQMFYEMNTIMVPKENFTDSAPGMSVEKMADMLASWAISKLGMHVGCTGIVAMDENDGMVYHARNLDFSFSKFMQAMAYTGVFTKNGVEIFRAQTIAGYSAVLTGMRKGPNGFGIEINTRFASQKGDFREYLHNLFTEKREISGWTKRKVLENVDNYEDAVHAFSTIPYVASEYNIVSGVKKGVVLARTPDGLAYKLPLSESNKSYIIMTNFDYPWHDLREMFDPTTVKGIGHPRRTAAEKILDRAQVITPKVLFQVLNDDGVMAKETIFQVIMNVETGLWNASLPACINCRDESLLIV
jgi:hypothetical protein